MGILGMMKEMKSKMAAGGHVIEFPDGHWSSAKFIDGNIMLDALVKHLLGLIHTGMTEAGEVLEGIAQLETADGEGWMKTWSAMGDRLKRRAEESEEKQKLVSASSAYLRASTYYRVSVMYTHDDTDSRMKKYMQESMDCYEKYLEYSGYPGEYVEIPYEDTYLPGHFYRSSVAEKKAPLLILTPGRDTFAEDTRWVYDEALKRGIHCLVYDGPGQGSALRIQGLKFRPDWENVLTPVIDFALTKEGIDPERIAIMGMSFGGFLSPRAVAFDKRVKLCIVDPGNLNWGGNFADIFSKVKKIPKRLRPAAVENMMQDYCWKHGTDMKNLIPELRKYDNTDIIDQVTCHMIVLDGTAEVTPGEAIKFYDALRNCEKDYILFDEETTAQSHTQMGGYAPAAEILFDRIEEYL